MKSRSIRVAVLSALVLTSPLLMLAAGQPKLHRLSTNQMQDLSGTRHAVRPGKGSGMTRNVEVPRASNYHLATARDLPTPGDAAPAERANTTDSAYRK
jgi:hypothetical protein